MKKFLLIIFILVLSGCSLKDERRTLIDAQALAEDHVGFDTFHFVVQANCDYEYFFEYEPMRIGGYYAYGYKDNQSTLLIIPKQANHEEMIVDWPINYQVIEAAQLLNSIDDEDIINEETLYSHVRFELTPSVLNDNSHIPHDVPFFIILSVNNENYIAFQRDSNLVIYHEDDGFIVSSET